MRELLSDELGKRVNRDVLELSTSDPYHLFKSRQGRGNITTLEQVQHHPAHHLLQQLSKTGASAIFSTQPWTAARNDAAIERGPHKSSYEHVEFLRKEMADMIDKGIWLTLPYHTVKHLKDLRISPIGVVPQHERRPRPIVDYSFHGVNDDTVRLAPEEAMQFGRALERILTQIVYANPRYGPIKLIKIDIADGFYRIKVKLEDIPKLGVAFPHLEGEPELVAFPLALPMGWTQSPPYFCAVTETIADVANERFQNWKTPLPHRLDEAASTPDDIHQPELTMDVPPRDPHLPTPNQPQRWVDVFVDDFIAGAQGNAKHLNEVRQTLMHTIDDVFRPIDDDDPSYRREPISVDKLKKGDAYWATRKKILGWIIDTVLMTITLPKRRADRLQEILQSITPHQKRLSMKTYHKILGELRSMSLALPGSRGLFSALQQAVHHKQDNRLRLNASFHSALDDFRWINADLQQRPTRLQEIVPTPPTLLGAHDASGAGAGGVWFPKLSATPRHVQVQRLRNNTLITESLPPNVPLLWRYRFPPDVVDDLVTWEHPTGKINNSELELAGAILHNEVAAQCYDIRERTVKAATDNIATMYWMRKGSITADSAAACLLRMQGLHQRFHRYVHLIDYIPGLNNDMADDASRLNHLTDTQLLAHFDSTYPQAQSWRLWKLPPQTTSAITTSLHNKTSTRELFLLDPKPPTVIGRRGRLSAPKWDWILPYKTSMTPSPSCKFLPTDTGTESSTQPKHKSALEQWKMPYAALAKRSRQWGPRTPA